MRRVFPWYGRDDSQTITGFIYQLLEDSAALGAGSVFMDSDDIPDGEVDAVSAAHPPGGGVLWTVHLEFP